MGRFKHDTRPKPAFIAHTNSVFRHKRNQRLVLRRERLETARRFQDAFFVMESSVSDQAGYGLYSLRRFARGERLPMVYPGVKCSSAEDFELLNDFLVLQTEEVFETDEVTDEYGWASWFLTERGERKLDATLGILKRVWDISIYFPSRDVGRDRRVNWDALYDSFIAYRFDNVYWNHYYADGRIKAHITTPLHAALYMNESGAYARFENRFSRRVQKTANNVESRCDDATGEIHFYAALPIAEGDELLLYYGEHYNRDGYESPVKLKPGVFRSVGIAIDDEIAADLESKEK